MLFTLKKTKSDDNNKKEHVVKQETAAMCTQYVHKNMRNNH